jgi:hypothetical protein
MPPDEASQPSPQLRPRGAANVPLTEGEAAVSGGFLDVSSARSRNDAVVLSKRVLIALLTFYVVLLVFGLLSSLYAIIPRIIVKSIPAVLTRATIGSLSMSAVGSTVFYLRKLYKAAISGRLQLDDRYELSIVRLGTAVYYFARPLFALAFSILVVVGLLAGFFAVSSPSLDLQQGFVFVTMFFSFFAGFSAGAFVRRLEESSDTFLDHIFPKE